MSESSDGLRSVRAALACMADEMERTGTFTRPTWEAVYRDLERLNPGEVRQVFALIDRAKRARASRAAATGDTVAQDAHGRTGGALREGRDANWASGWRVSPRCATLASS